ncbi:MAG: mismatch-specific DNA-glycosylase [Anaerolineae bacterium]|nr:mismatch-specific DNA-glycosylase [Anaerolineae bacterium]
MYVEPVTDKLPDVFAHHLKVIFCGTAASAISAQEKAYYANPTNYFWRTLYKIGLTPHQLTPKDFPQLLDYRIGLTDMAKQAQGNDSDLSKSDFDVESFLQKVATYQPKVIAFTSKKAASIALKTTTRKLSYSLQPGKLEQSQVWVLTSPSGAARAYWDESIWQSLADFVSKM